MQDVFALKGYSIQEPKASALGVERWYDVFALQGQPVQEHRAITFERVKKANIMEKLITRRIN